MMVQEPEEPKQVAIGPALLEIVPMQPGPQTQFLEADADIVIIGGSAGGGKTWAELLLPTQRVDNRRFGAVIFRRKMKQVTDEGGLWDQSAELYPLVGAKPNSSERFWTFPSGATIQFAGLENETSKYDYQGSEICDLLLDELTHFTEGQFWYMLSRNRSTCGYRPRCRATTNPHTGWVKRLLAPWVDKKFSNPAKSGEVRWFIRQNDQTIWLDGPPPPREACTDGEDGEGCLREGCKKCFPPEKSITFIRSTVYDNKELLRKDPGYVSNLLAQTEVEKRRLHDGDWDAKPAHRVLDGYDEHIHLVEPFKIDQSWIIAVGSDFGSINAANVAIAKDPTSEDLYVIGEDWPGHSRSTKEICDEIRRICGGTPKIGCGGNRTVEQGSVESYKLHGIPMTLPEFRDVAVQYQCVNDAFRDNKLFIFNTCTNLIGMIETFEREKDVDGVVTDKIDDSKFHLPAALRYIISKLRPPKPGRRQVEMTLY